MIRSLSTIHICKLVITMSALLLLISCGGGSSSNPPSDAPPPNNPPPSGYTYQAPLDLADGLTVATSSAVNVSETELTGLVQDIENGVYGIVDGIAIYKNDTLILDETFRSCCDEFDAWIGNLDSQRHIMHSVSKSITGVLFMIALEQGYITSLDDPVLNYLPDVIPQTDLERKQRITIRHMLEMRAGFEWDESTYPYGSAQNSLTQLTNQYNWTNALFSLPMSDEPGTRFNYNTGVSNVLMDVLGHAVGEPAADFSERTLFEPLQITDAEWALSPTGFPIGGSGLFLTNRDVIKLGAMMLGNGTFSGSEIMQPDSVEALTSETTNIVIPYTSGYGLHWWIGSFNNGNNNIPMYAGRGFGSQFIVVIPSLNAVIITLGSNYVNDQYWRPMEMIQTQIIPLLD